MVRFGSLVQKTLASLGLVLLMGAEGGPCDPPPTVTLPPGGVWNICQPEAGCVQNDSASSRLKCQLACGHFNSRCGTENVCVFSR